MIIFCNGTTYLKKSTCNEASRWDTHGLPCSKKTTMDDKLAVFLGIVFGDVTDALYIRPPMSYLHCKSMKISDCKLGSWYQVFPKKRVCGLSKGKQSVRVSIGRLVQRKSFWPQARWQQLG